MLEFLVLLLGNGLTLLILHRLVPDEVAYTSIEAVVIFALVLTLLNFVVRPILQLIALPLTCLTFGLFAIVVNAVVFYAAAILSIGVDITILGALLGTLLAGLLNSVLIRVFAEG